MKALFTGIVLFALPVVCSAELSVTTELLLGTAKHKIQTSSESDEQVSHYPLSTNDDVYGFRLGVGLSDNFAFELAAYNHGKSTHVVTTRIPTVIDGPDGPVVLGPEFDEILQTNLPIDLESIRLGVKGQVEVYQDTFLTARLGLAHWQYDNFTPDKLTRTVSTSGAGHSGNDIYYSVGAEYRVSDTLYLGVEYALLNIQESVDSNVLASSAYEHKVKDLMLVVGWAF